MSLSAQIQKQVSEGFKQLGDLVKDVTYIAPDAAPYNPTTGGGGTGAQYQGRCVFVAFTKRQINGSTILMTDRQAIFAKLDLTFDISRDGKLVVDGVTYQIIDLSEDPAAASLSVHVRR